MTGFAPRRAEDTYVSGEVPVVPPTTWGLAVMSGFVGVLAVGLAVVGCLVIGGVL